MSTVVPQGPKPGYDRSRDESLAARLRDIFGIRWLSLILAILLVQLGFIASYVGAFHDPRPQQLQVTVISNHNWQEYVANQLNKISGQPVWAYAESNETTATQDLKSGKRQGVYVFDPQGDTDKLLIATSTGSSNAAAIELIFTKVAADKDRQLVVQDVAPVQAGDNRGLTGFYLVVGWLVGGYLMASMVGVIRGGRARNWRRMLWRLVLCAGYGVVSGLLGALIVDTWLGALTGHFWQLALLGAVVSMTASIVTMGLSAVFGVIGVGVSILLFVVLGNPSAGGAFNYGLLPQPWRFIGQWLPNGAGVDAVRSIVYLDGEGLGFHYLVLAWWLALGLLLFLAAANNTYWGFRRPDLIPARSGGARHATADGRHAAAEDD
ncbi:DUF3533 domain-containing protein [Calidifontibacter sp. DB0510]|uniref:DUF3533 domain-containing protein n=1 Tax=Metallococcus carri TaxID=1656884 RepID=A0A967EHT7_9MICO|nr:DUF3533 domain-containing protein [Metallococcus carri]NHN57048.1 DUF3533 domain-containing protein [Metallococcus carri]NOP39083.1 DUF3533 domain-containing protein [Calidifontibacter sp. DB2511S]